MLDERRQFAILYRDFLRRMVDLELLSARGEIQNLLGQFAALLAAFSFVLALFVVTSSPPRAQLLVAGWAQEEFLIATSMATVGLFTVLAWNSILLDRRDRLVLGMLPIRIRTIFMAKMAAIGTGLVLSVVAVNVFTGLSFPWQGDFIRFRRVRRAPIVQCVLDYDVRCRAIHLRRASRY